VGVVVVPFFVVRWRARDAPHKPCDGSEEEHGDSNGDGNANGNVDKFMRFCEQWLAPRGRGSEYRVHIWHFD